MPARLAQEEDSHGSVQPELEILVLQSVKCWFLDTNSRWSKVCK